MTALALAACVSLAAVWSVQIGVAVWAAWRKR